MSTTIYLVMGTSMNTDFNDNEEWALKAFTEHRRAMIHVELLTREQEYYNETIKKIIAFADEWMSANVDPEHYELQKVEKFPSGRMQDITEAMRAKRLSVQMINNKLQEKYAAEYRAWNERKFQAINEYIKVIATPEFATEHSPWKLYYPSERRNSYFVAELELD